MGQYHCAVNFDMKEVVSPHKIGLGLKQSEHAHTIASLPDVLYMLLTTSPNRGGGDLDYDGQLEKEFKTFGRWVGDKVAIFGDYTEPQDVPFLKIASEEELHQYVGTFNDITDKIIPAFEKAFFVKIHPGEGWRERVVTSGWDWLLK